MNNTGNYSTSATDTLTGDKATVFKPYQMSSQHSLAQCEYFATGE